MPIGFVFLKRSIPPRAVKIALAVAALAIAAGSLIISHSLVSDLKTEEQVKMEIWAEAMRSFIRADENADLNLVLRVTESNHTIPIIIQDERGNITEHRNIDVPYTPDSTARLQAEARAMRQAGRVMNIDHPEGHFTISYGESLMLRRLAAYPYIQLAVVTLFICVTIYALLSSKRAEQNKVWVGLSRETAHQLGTPTSSLMAWTEVLRETYPDEPLISDMSLDVERLQLIADRFSKIGSAPVLRPEDLGEVIATAAAYIRRRASEKVVMRVKRPEDPLIVPLNTPLFAWVIENLCKNAIDAMSGSGSITIVITQTAKKAIVTVTDTGKGIPRNHFKTVFRPGFTTKKRGWGLGLSLAKRIIEQYHNGSIFVKQSEIGGGTTFCISLPLGHNATTRHQG